MPYDLRHFHCSYLLSRVGQPGALTVTQISDRKGHASTHMTLTRYAHALPSDNDQMDAALDAAFGGDDQAARLRAV